MIPKLISQEKVDEIKRLIECGLSLRDISTSVKVSYATVYRVKRGYFDGYSPKKKDKKGMFSWKDFKI